MLIMVIFIGILGLALGSFFNVCIARIPNKKSIVFPASHCPKCQTPIKFYDNIPVISYLILRGRCRECDEPISPRYMLVELFTAIMYMLLFYKYGFEPEFFVYVLFASLLIIVAFSDLENYIIPNVIVLPGVLIGFGLNVFLLHNSYTEVLISTFSGAIYFGIIALLYYALRKQEGMGAGDIKLMAMIGAFTNVFTLFFTIIAGSVFGLAFFPFFRKKGTIPFGFFLAFAAIAGVYFMEDIPGIAMKISHSIWTIIY